MWNVKYAATFQLSARSSLYLSRNRMQSFAEQIGCEPISFQDAKIINLLFNFQSTYDNCMCKGNALFSALNIASVRD